MEAVWLDPNTVSSFCLYHAAPRRILNSRRTENGHSEISQVTPCQTARQQGYVQQVWDEVTKGNVCVNLPVSSTTSLQSRYQVLSNMTHIFICTASLQ
jgi:hypothetical protein